MTSSEMLAFQKLSSAPGDASVTKVLIPDPGPGEVLIRIAGCGICGSDLHTVRSDPGYEWVPTPVVIGHECAGTVAKSGLGCSWARPGDRVVPMSIQGCLVCETCKAGHTQLCDSRKILGLHYAGALAEYAVVPESQLVLIPEDVDTRAAVLTEPLTVAVHAMLGRTTVQPGMRVVVSGAGTIGLLAAQIARASGADVLLAGASSDARRRLPIGDQLGLRTGDIESDSVADVLRRHFGHQSPHVWVEASGAISALGAGIESIRAGGQITIVAMYAQPYSLMVSTMLRREISLVTTYAANAADYATALQLLVDKVVNVELLMDEYPLSRAAKAFDDAATGRAVKPIVVPDPGPVS